MDRKTLGWIAAIYVATVVAPALGQDVSHLPDPATGPISGADSQAISRSMMESRQNLAVELKHAREEKAVPVPPVLEIEVLDPRVDPLGNPAVVTTRDAQNRLVVDIPPVVLVHRYYYTGDRSFQGPLLPGGPSILVLNHPRTGERIYLELQMLPGAPRVTYTRHSIEYDYGFQTIAIKFGAHGKPGIEYRQGMPLGRRVEIARDHVRDSVGGVVQRTGIPTAARKVGGAMKNAAGTAIDRTRQVGKMAVTPVVQILRVTPLGSAFTNSPEQLATRARDVNVQQAAAQATQAEADFKTLR